MSDEKGLHRIVCSSCGKEIECCAFCEEPECARAVCLRCIAIAVRQRMRQPHLHGG